MNIPPHPDVYMIWLLKLLSDSLRKRTAKNLAEEMGITSSEVVYLISLARKRGWEIQQEFASPIGYRRHYWLQRDN